MKRSFFQAAVVSILLYGCTTWTLIKRLEKKLDGNYTRMLRAILNKTWRQHPTRHQLYGHLPPITKTIQIRRTRHAGHCWRSRDELIRVLLWIPKYSLAKVGRPGRTYIHQLCEDTGCSPEDLPEAMNDWEDWQEKVRDVCPSSTTWWWWWWPGRSEFIQLWEHSSRLAWRQNCCRKISVSKSMSSGLKCRKTGHRAVELKPSKWRVKVQIRRWGVVERPGSICITLTIKFREGSVME